MKWTFWVSVALIAYTYVGYVGWLWLRSRWRPRPVQRGTFEPFVSIVMVVRDEERVLGKKIENLLRLDYPEHLMELVIVSDGSKDLTETILREHASDPRVHAVMKQLSTGKAMGLNDALQIAHGEIVIFTDARQEIESSAIRILLNNFADPEVGCVSGELMLGDPHAGEKSRGMGLYWRVEKRVRELESASGSVVGATGAFYGVRRELLGTIPPEILLDDVYIPMEVVRAGKARGVRAASSRLGHCRSGHWQGVRPQGEDPEWELSTPAGRALVVECGKSYSFRIHQSQAVAAGCSVCPGQHVAEQRAAPATALPRCVCSAIGLLRLESREDDPCEFGAVGAVGRRFVDVRSLEHGGYGCFRELCDPEEGCLVALSIGRSVYSSVVTRVVGTMAEAKGGLAL